MTGFDLRAVGWVVTRDIFADALRTAFGAPPRIEPDALQALGAQWCKLQDACSRDPDASSLAALLSPSTRLSAPSADALAAFVDRLTALCPDRYGLAALRRRGRTSLAQACIGCFGGGLLSGAAVSPDTLVGDVALVLLVMGLCHLVSATQLWRTLRIVKRLGDRDTDRPSRSAAHR
jgi:hypothetical protein